jgi:hypothetical protein
VLVENRPGASDQSFYGCQNWIRNGKLKVLSVVNEKRLAALPDSPITGETVSSLTEFD